MNIYRAGNTRMQSWYRMKWFYERKLTTKPEMYELMNYFDPYVYNQGGSLAKSGDKSIRLLKVFFKKYPEAHYWPVVAQPQAGYYGATQKISPGIIFVRKQMELIRKGFTEMKAFEMVEADMSEIFEREKEDSRIQRNLVTNNRARTFLDFYQQKAELEGRQKVKRMERDLPKYMRARQLWEMETDPEAFFAAEGGDGEEEVNDTEAISKEIEEKDKGFASLKLSEEEDEHYIDPIDFRQYEPVLYSIQRDEVDFYDSDESDDLEGIDEDKLEDIHAEFLQRSEYLLRIHRQRAEIHDGLAALSDADIIRKVSESPTRLKKHATNFLKKLKHHGVVLNYNGEVDFSRVSDTNVLKVFQKYEPLIKTTLMHADLEFEYPHKIERMIIKGRLLEIIEAEEKRLTDLENLREASELKKKIVTYEEFYDSMSKVPVEKQKPEINAERAAIVTTEAPSRYNVSFEAFQSEYASNYLFDQDLTGQRYKFWESEEQRIERLKKTWMDLKKTNALGGVDARTPSEQEEMHQVLAELIRKVRWRIDQELVKKGEHPVFKDFYNSYTKDEFMIDSDVEFFKLHSFLSLNPRTLQEDPQIGLDYSRILNLIKRKKLTEVTRPAFGEEVHTAYHDEFIEKPQDIEKTRIEKTGIQETIDYINEQGDIDEGDTLDLDNDPERTKTISILKKEKVKDKDKFLKHFEEMTKKMEEGVSYKVEKKKETKNLKTMKTRLKLKARKEAALAEKAKPK